MSGSPYFDLPSRSLSHRIALAILRRLVVHGRLKVLIPGEGEVMVGAGGTRYATMTLPRLGALLSMLVMPDPRFLDGYVLGEWECPEGEIEDVLNLFTANLRSRPPGIPRRLINVVSKILFRLRQIQSIAASRRYVSHHYDIGNELYFGFLGESLQYSCGFFDENHGDLDAAQRNKVEVTLSRLDLGEEMRVLDIGSGWGGLSREIVAGFPTVHAVGITLSEQQFRYAQVQRSAMPHAAERLHYELVDYRRHCVDKSAVYDRIVSVGMFEHVGLPQYLRFFQTARRLLKSGGKMLLHTIVQPFPDTGSVWFARNIFPGGYIPAASQVLAAAEKAGFSVAEIFCHSSDNYRKTLCAWRENYRRMGTELPAEKYDAHFHRMWEMYFSASIHIFDPCVGGCHQVMQFLLCPRKLIL